MSIFEDTLDNYAANNPLTNMNLYYKVFFVILTIIINLLAQSPIIPTIIFLFVSCLILFKLEIKPSFYIKFISVPFAFGFITTIFMAFFFGIGPHIFDLGLFNWGITSDGLNRGVLVLARVMGGFSCLAFLVLSTPMNRLFVLFDECHVPDIVTDLAILMYRYIFLFLDVTLEIYHSQKTRLGYKNMKSSFQCLGILAGMVFIRTWEQGESAYSTLVSRGYDGKFKLLKKQEYIYDITKTQILMLVVFELLIIIGIILTGTINVV